MHSIAEAMHAAELAGAAVYLRAVLARAASEEPDVLAVRFEATFETPGFSVIEVEIIGRSGMAIGGYSL